MSAGWRLAGWRLPAPVAVLASLVALAGCGSSSLSDQQLRARATRACAVASAWTGRIRSPGSPAGAAAFIEQGLAALEPEYRTLRSLRAPSDLAQVYAVSLSAFSGKLAALRAAAIHMRHGSDPMISVKTLQQRIAPLEASEDGAWTALQIPACLNH